MNESLYDNMVNYILHKEYPSECKKVDKYVLRRTAKIYSVEITPANKDDSSIGDGRPILWFVGKGKKLLVIKGEQEKKRVFLEFHASNYGGHVRRDNTIKKKSAKDTTGQSIIKICSRSCLTPATISK